MAHKRPLTRKNGLTELESRYVLLKCADPNVPEHIIAKRAGYKGTPEKLRSVAAALNTRPQIIAALKDTKGIPSVSKENVTAAINQILHRDNVLPAVKVSAARLLLETIPGAFVPVTVNHSGQITLEAWVENMGGKPRELEAPAAIEAEVLGREENPPSPGETIQ